MCLGDLHFFVFDLFAYAYIRTYVPLQARKAVEARAQIQQKLAQKQKESKEEQMRILAAQAREMRAGIRVETANNGNVYICLLDTCTSVVYDITVFTIADFFKTSLKLNLMLSYLFHNFHLSCFSVVYSHLYIVW